jgi:hypothetical protein
MFSELLQLADMSGARLTIQRTFRIADHCILGPSNSTLNFGQ